MNSSYLTLHVLIGSMSPWSSWVALSRSIIIFSSSVNWPYRRIRVKLEKAYEEVVVAVVWVHHGVSETTPLGTRDDGFIGELFFDVFGTLVFQHELHLLPSAPSNERVITDAPHLSPLGFLRLWFTQLIGELFIAFAYPGFRQTCCEVRLRMTWLCFEAAEEATFGAFIRLMFPH